MDLLEHMGKVHEMWGTLKDRRRKGGYKRK